MLKIRFQRTGRKNLPFFRIVVAEHARAVKGKFIDIVGHFNPKTKELKLENDKIIGWISKGAQVSDRVARLATKGGISQCEKFIGNRLTKPTKSEKEASDAIAKEKKEAAEARAKEKAQKAKEQKAS